MFINTLLSKSRVSLAFIVLFLTGISIDANAQESSVGKETSDTQQSLVDLISTSERSVFSPTQQISKGRLDANANVMRAMYRIDGAQSVSLSGSPTQRSRAFLQEHADPLGLDASLLDLDLVREVSTEYTSHTTYQQFYEGIPVYGRFVKVNMNRRGEVTMVLNGYHPDLRLVGPGGVSPGISDQEAINRAQDYLDLAIERASDGELMVYPSESPRLVWRFLAWTTYPSLELEFLIDARDGAFVAVTPTNTHVHDVEIGADAVYGHSEISRVNSPSIQPVENQRRASGTGLVFDPDPLTS
ncbi:MAG: hypothetical protein KTR29_18775, partial [Rhodothermaceae bacterium]|nr:hypothetical protein [Rhodothermaceae bacterium]